MWWFWWWILFVVILFLMPLGYGWGYRGWGPPYPYFYRRTRLGRGPAQPPAGSAGSSASVDTTGAPSGTQTDMGWGAAADAVWIVLLVALVWLIIALWWW